ncbi:peptidoglycan recognition protein family protein [Lactobacillus terrae]|uniref:peptidoglycan recognition protein family protein n=1 Tax=Lactobacillus terrae TaxID=2269374 RepID=UPI000C1B65B0|nr:N-acetylmuramoyl-L-alanine amidase [Lactobacillus terrae]
MAKQLNINVTKGIAGRRPTANPKGIVIHNDAGSLTAEDYAYKFLPNHNLEAGFAHYYGDRNSVVRVEDTYNMAWHTASREGNTWYVGYEVCQSMSASDVDFLANEQAVFKQAAEDLMYWGLPANRDTVKLHREFVPTACPHRSWALHGATVNSVKGYFIQEIKKYMNGEVSDVIERDTITVKYVPNYGVLSFNKAGASYKDSNLTFKHDTRWKTAGIEVINGRAMYQVATDMYVPKEYTDQAGLVTINSIKGITSVNDKGNVNGDSYKDLTQWKTNDNGVKKIKGKLYFPIAPDINIDSFYTIGGGNK